MSYTYIYRVVEKGTGTGAFRLGLVPYRVACSIPTPRFETPAFDPYQHEEGHYGFTKTQFRKFLDLLDAHTTDTEKDIFAYDAEVRVFRVASEDIRVSASHQTVFHLNTPVRKLPLTNAKMGLSSDIPLNLIPPSRKTNHAKTQSLLVMRGLSHSTRVVPCGNEGMSAQ